MIIFDKEAPGGGVDAYSVIENGKAEVRFTIYLTQAARQDSALPSGESGASRVELTMYDPKGREAARMVLKAEGVLPEALTTRTLLIYPQLWQSVDSPLLYRVRALLLAGEEIADRKEFVYPICSMSSIGGKGFFLNDKPFTLHAVRYPVTSNWREYLEKDLDILLELGANCICPDRFVRDSMFYEMCLHKGLIIWKLAGGGDRLPLLWGDQKALLSHDRLRRKDLFYYYQACWSDRDVLHICSHARTPRPGTTASAVVYSNQKKVALYVNGILQEFKQSPPEFIFEDIPVKGEHTVISAQAGECFTSVTWSV